MKNTRSWRVAFRLTLAALAAVSCAHALRAQGPSAPSAPVGPANPTTFRPTFEIGAGRITRGMVKGLPADMFEGGVQITPYTLDGTSLSLLTIEQGKGILIFKSTTVQGKTTLLGYTPFDVVGETITVRNGVTTYRDKAGRTVRVLPPPPPHVFAQ